MNIPEPKFSIGEQVICVDPYHPPTRVGILGKRYGENRDVRTHEIHTCWYYDVDYNFGYSFPIAVRESNLRPLPPKATKSLKAIMEQYKYEDQQTSIKSNAD